MTTSSSSTTDSWTPSDSAKIKAQSLATTAQVARMTTVVAEYQQQAQSLARALRRLEPWL